MNKDKKEESIQLRITLTPSYFRKWKAMCGDYRGRDFLMQIIDKEEKDRLIKPAGEDLPEGTVFTNNN